MASAVRCPLCRKSVSFDDPNMPFCSERCRLLDLGNWAAEKYVIPGNAQLVEEDPEETDFHDGPVQ